MKTIKHISLIMVLGLVVISCDNQRQDKEVLTLDPAKFQVERDGRQLGLYTLKNTSGITVQITNYGGKIVSIIVPDRYGNLADVCLGYESAEGYFSGAASMGATMGRFANRIANAEFTLNDSTYRLAQNNGAHTIHGGEKGFRFKVWDARQLDDQNLELTYFSEDGEEGFPGNLTLKVLFSLTENDELVLKYHASTDMPTILNVTNHAFFNLAGEGSDTVLDHELLVVADTFTPVDDTAIPTGELRPVAGTAMDFRQLTRLGDRIGNDDDQLKFVGGYDHNFVLNKEGNELALAALLYEPVSGRVMEVKTTEPGIQVYTANSLTGKGPDVGKGGKPYSSQSAICLETQHFPDSPHHDHFPSTVLNPGEDYFSETVYRFSVKE
ncbi:MAG: galactose mutarotase [Cyclobacteriaceae bacterium]|nr:galactose mutarotase [Cyclobacteriaceae bacterium]